ncbi:hypothetical protein BJY04DRAFT_196016 [Aspergillus karnatakaensis]|uniref:uncharacterized protein n=1 Tax=Aspergillus karnatakaensis TaxID=1810916 RepID=UPI003CCD0A64
MMRPRDPRVRQTINQLSHNFESANETAQEGIYTLSHNYILPCFSAVGNCLSSCSAPCLPTREDRLRRRRRHYADFDFYDDWDNDDVDDTILGWGTDELDRLLAGSGLARGSSEQPRRQRKMSYGARRTSRRKSGLLIPDDRNDPTVIPSSSFLGFLERFPWRLGARGLKYRPSAADLQEHPTGLRHVHEENPLIESGDENGGGVGAGSSGNGRYRSSTQSSRETANSLSSRGDLIMSDEEEDAVPLDDEFAMALTRRGTGAESDDQGGDKPASMRSGNFSTAPTTSSRSSKNKKKKTRASRVRSPPSSYIDVSEDPASVSIEDLKREDEQAARDEESEIIRKRLAARKLAMNRGIGMDSVKTASLSHSPTISSDVAPQTTSINTPIEPVAEQNFTFNAHVLNRQDSATHLSDTDSRTEPFPPLPDEPTHIDPIEDSHVPLNVVDPLPVEDGTPPPNLTRTNPESRE